MNMTDTQFDGLVYGLAWGLWVLCLGYSIRQAPWKRLAEDGRIHLWLGSIVTLTLLWSIKAGIQPGLELHLLGANLLLLAFGPALATLAIACVLCGLALNAGAGWLALGLNGLLLGVWAPWVGFFLYRAVVRWFPPQIFVFIFLNGFFSAGMTLVSVGLLSTLLLGFSGLYTLSFLSEEYLPYFLLLAFSESWLNGMVVTFLVIYKPEWLLLFNRDRYFKHSDRIPFR